MKKNKSRKNLIFVCCVILIAVFIYITCVFLPWIALSENIYTLNDFYVFIAHLFLFLFFWSLAKVILTDPGKVPYYWGLFFNDGDYKKRRYCLICHVFKPERCHHCSSCERCVLNMDHHCPWINNCVGFFNRKFFILMLFYTVLSSFTVFCGTSIVLWKCIEEILNDFQSMEAIDWVVISLITIGFIIDTVLFIMMFLFFLTHLKFVFTNFTTIENLDRLRPNSNAANISYDNGIKYNWFQVFGRNPYLWLFPLFGESGRPVGNGVNWISKRNELDENDPGYQQMPERLPSKPNESQKNTPREEE